MHPASLPTWEQNRVRIRDRSVRPPACVGHRRRAIRECLEDQGPATLVVDSYVLRVMGRLRGAVGVGDTRPRGQFDPPLDVPFDVSVYRSRPCQQIAVNDCVREVKRVRGLSLQRLLRERRCRRQQRHGQCAQQNQRS